jgi:hypothetical protein
MVMSKLAGNGASKQGKLTYQFVAETATNLVRLAQSDPIILGSLCSLPVGSTGKHTSEFAKKYWSSVI